MGDAPSWVRHFHIYAVDLIGEPGLSAPSRPPLDSDAYALWLDDVLRELSITRTSLVGVSFGGWLALGYASRRPEAVAKVVAICPAGVGRQKIGVLLKAPLLLMLGEWSRKD